MRHRELRQQNIDNWTRNLVVSPPTRWWVAEREAQLVGFVGIGPSRDPIDPNLGELHTIAIDPPHWRTGAGRELMSVAVETLEQDGYPEAILWTLENYPMGQHFYEATGWSRDGGARDNGTKIRYRINLER